MARVEFGGLIGGTGGTLEPWWPPVPKPPEGAPNVVLIVLDDVGFAQLGCDGIDMDTPALRRAGRRRVCACPISTPPPCAPPPGRACSPDGTITAAPWAGSPTWPSGFPGYWGKPPVRTGTCRRSAADGYATYAVGQMAPHPRRRDQHGGVARDVAAGPGAPPVVRLPRGGTHQSCRPCSTTTTLPGPLGPSRRAIT